jgi:tetratricopeptide (TPR) repeat protein
MGWLSRRKEAGIVRPLRLLALVLVVFAALPIRGDDKKPPAPQPTIEELVADLGHPVYSIREKAQRELWKRGEAAIPALERALKDDSPEVARRAAELLSKFAWGIRPDTPPEVLKLLRKFQAGDPDPTKNAAVRKSAVLDLLRSGPSGVSIAKAILTKNLTKDARDELSGQITAILRREVPLRLFEGKTDQAAELIALHAIGTNPEGAADYAAFQVLSNNLPAAIASAEAALKATRRTDNHKLLLASLYRASGEWAKAREIAKDLPNADGTPNLTDLLREDAGDWAALAENYPTGSANHPEALRLTFLRLAGRDRDFDTELEALLKASNNYASADETFQAVVALFSNHRPDDATRLLLGKRHNLGLLGEVFIQRLRYKEALDLIASLDKPGAQLSDRERLEFDLRRARVLMIVGHRDDAVQLFNKVAKGLQHHGRSGEGSPIVAVRSLLRAEMRLGLKDLAAEHAATFVTTGLFDRHTYSYTGESAFELLFYTDATAAEMIFQTLRAKKIPGDEPGPTLSRTRDLLLGKANKPAVDEALKALRDANDPTAIPIYPTPGPGALEPRIPPPSTGFQLRRHLAIGAVCRAANRDADAEKAYRAAAELASEGTDIGGARSWVYGTSDAYLPYVEWGDFLCERQRYHEAARRYLEGWKKFPDQPLLLLLSGRALVWAGDAKEGERRMELSHWVSLGQERVRGKFLDELIRRGEGKAARHETQVVMRACWSRDHFFGNVMNQCCRASAMVKDFATAETACQRSLLVMLKTQGMYYVESSAYMVVPHSILIYRARARLDQGKTDEAVKLAREALAVTPGNVELVVGMVPTLEKRGKKAEADELFGIAWKAHQGVLKEYPDSPASKNALATLCADCRRELDKGLKYAQEAVKTEPASVVFRETLAEVHFRRGERDQAAAVMTKLLTDDPRNATYRRYLARYQTGTLDSPRPDTED